MGHKWFRYCEVNMLTCGKITFVFIFIFYQTVSYKTPNITPTFIYIH